jgi:multiple sugar transport system permease protein
MTTQMKSYPRPLTTDAPHFSWSRVSSRVLVYGLLLLGVVLVLLPLFWMISTSLKPTNQVFKMPPQWIPNPILWANYDQALFGYNPNFLVFFKNTLFIEILVVPGVVLSSSLAAYSFSRMRWPGRDLVFMAILATMMLPGAVTLVPTFIAWSRLGAIDTFTPLILPAWFGGGAFNIFLLRQFMLNIPRDLEDAARIDGAGYFYIYWRVVLPLVRPALTAIAIFTFIGVWNDFFGPLIYLNSNRNFTIALGLTLFKQLYGTKWNLLMAASVATMIPIIVILLIFQRRIIQGVNITSGLNG